MIHKTNPFHFTIRVYSEVFPHVHSHTIRWDRMTIEQLTKWTWYFQYRSALEKVKNPRFEVVNTWGQYQEETKTALELEKEETMKKLNARKSQVSKWQNAIDKFKDNWNQLFPYEEDPVYLKAIEKLYTNKTKLKELSNKYDQLCKSKNQILTS